VITVDGRPVAVMGFTVTGGKIVAIDALSDPERVRRLDLAPLFDD
jgi:RNA polymerase sigma-70 factor (ECF subfamily)